MRYKKILDYIIKYDRIIIHGHMRPDGDCIGSQLGLKHLILENFKEKEVFAVGESSDYVSFLGNMDIIPDDYFKDALSIIVDCGNQDRVSDQRFLTSKEYIKIDHHVAIENYGMENFVDENSPACCQIITEFAIKNSLKINETAARSLYVGIITDTGRFRYQGVNKRTFICAAELISHNIDIQNIDNLLSKETMNSIMLKGYIYSNLQFTQDGVCYFVMKKEIIEKFNMSHEEAAALVNSYANIDGYPVWFLLVEYPTELRIRIRSRGPEVDVLANKYNGGGHKMASGAKLNSLNELDDFLIDINNLVKEYKEKNEKN